MTNDGRRRKRRGGEGREAGKRGEMHPRARRDSHPDLRGDQREWEEERKADKQESDGLMWRKGEEEKREAGTREKQQRKGKKRERRKSRQTNVGRPVLILFAVTRRTRR